MVILLETEQKLKKNNLQRNLWRQKADWQLPKAGVGEEQGVTA